MPSDSLANRPKRFRRIVTTGALAMTLIASAGSSTARADDDDAKPLDARLDGYTAKVVLTSNSTGLTWALFVVLAGCTVGVMFKDARRSHLD